MATVEIRIPQLGEGLHEARIVRFLKHPGDSIRRDEPIYEMETDKAVMEIESPEAGILSSWCASEGDVLPIGAVIAEVEAGASQASSSSPVPEPALRVPSAVSLHDLMQDGNGVAAAPSPVAPILLRNRHVSPRARAHARSLGVSDQQVAEWFSLLNRRVMTEDIDQLIARAPAPGSATMPLPPHQPQSTPDGADYVDLTLPAAQRTLIFRLQSATQAVIPATLELLVPWGLVEEARERLRSQGTECSQFTVFAWCVAQAAKEHPAFRSALVGDSTLRQYERVHLGIAVARPGDELLIARVANADALSISEFAAKSKDAITLAREGKDQASEAMQISLTNMAASGSRFGVPVVAAPSVATLFIGAPWDEAYPLGGGGIGFKRTAAMVMTFDHRIANGVGAAEFLNSVKSRVEQLPALIP